MDAITRFLDMIRAFVTLHPLLALFLSGIWSAVAIDLTSFVQAAEPGDWLSQFNTKKHLLRWLQAGIGTALGMTAVAGGAALIGLGLYAWFF